MEQRRLTRPNRNACRGFTVIELLVAIFILTILAAILFPVFVRLREVARQSTCLSHLRQIGMAHRMYAQDWDDRLPHWCFAAPPRPEPFGDFQFWTEYLQPYLRSPAVLRDPGAAWLWDMPEEEKLAEYALATWGRGGRGTLKDPHWQWPGLPMGLTDVVRPAETLLVIDGWTTGGWTSMDLRRHHGGTIACFVDGHAARMPEGEFWRVDRGGDGSHWFHYAAADRGD